MLPQSKLPLRLASFVRHIHPSIRPVMQIKYLCVEIKTRIVNSAYHGLYSS